MLAPPREGYLRMLHPELRDLLDKFRYECNFSVFILDAEADRLLDLAFGSEPPMHVLVRVQRNAIEFTTVPGIMSLTTADETYQDLVLDFVRSVGSGFHSVLVLSPATQISYYQGSFTVQAGDNIVVGPIPACRQLVEALLGL